MNIVPWRREGNGFTALRKQLNRLFEDFGGVGEPGFGALTFSGDVGPALDVAETPETFVVKAEIPGVEAKDIDISVTGNTLTLKGEKHEEKEEKGKTWHRVERSYGSFCRTVTLPVPVKADRIEAESRDGVLTVTVPKSVEAMPKKIAVKTK
jgi:HSP20 family protein